MKPTKQLDFFGRVVEEYMLSYTSTGFIKNPDRNKGVTKTLYDWFPM